MDLSLDDIIQKRNIRVPFKGRGGNNRQRQQGRGTVPNRTSSVPNRSGSVPKRTGNTNFNKKFINNRNAGGAVISGRVGKVDQTRPITDARQKIIEKNRRKLTDAREKLGEIAKQTDARLKLEKLHKSRQTGHIPLSEGNLRLPGRRNNDLQQRRNPQVPLQRTIRQSVGTIVVPNNWYRATVDNMDVDMELDAPFTGVSQVLRRTIPNEQATSRQLHKSSTYSPWPTSQHRVPKEPEPVSRGFGDLYYPEDRVRVKPQANVSLTNRWGSRSANPAPVQTASSLKPRSPGYRIVISNLHASVIHEDIQELFEDVGPLLESRLVRPGTAEVVFKELKDAERAVEIYHNRQLDRQPMKCMLVHTRPVGSTSAPSYSASRAMTGSIAKTGVKAGSGSKSAVVPDISTIHKALFNRPRDWY